MPDSYTIRLNFYLVVYIAVTETMIAYYNILKQYLHVHVHNSYTIFLVHINVTLSHLRSKEPPGLHFICSPASRLQLGSNYIDVEVKINCGDQLILM